MAGNAKVGKPGVFRALHRINGSPSIVLQGVAVVITFKKTVITIGSPSRYFSGVRAFTCPL